MCELWDLDPEQIELSILSCEREAAHDSHSKGIVDTHFSLDLFSFPISLSSWLTPTLLCLVSQPPSPDTCTAAVPPTQSTKQGSLRSIIILSLALLALCCSILLFHVTLITPTSSSSFYFSSCIKGHELAGSFRSDCLTIDSPVSCSDVVLTKQMISTVVAFNK